jgi:hypothetical protein
MICLSHLLECENFIVLTPKLTNLTNSGKLATQTVLNWPQLVLRLSQNANWTLPLDFLVEMIKSQIES